MVVQRKDVWIKVWPCGSPMWCFWGMEEEEALVVEVVVVVVEVQVMCKASFSFGIFS